MTKLEGLKAALDAADAACYAAADAYNAADALHTAAYDTARYADAAMYAAADAFYKERDKQDDSN